jgi:hypothetical protein
VRATPCGERSSRDTPVSRSSDAICCETADWVRLSRWAAPEKEPSSATASRIRSRRESSMTPGYAMPDRLTGRYKQRY